MRQYIIKRTIYALFIIWAVATIVFFATRALPGGPVQTILGQNAAPEAITELRQQLGLNRPLPVQYIDWMVGLLTFDFGQSLTSGKQIETIVMNAAPRTLSIGLIGIIVGLAVAIPTGLVSAVYKDQPLDYVATVSAFLGLSMPAFFIGILLAIIFGVWLSLLPVFGYMPLREGFVPWLKHIILPGIAVGLPYAAIIMRMTRSSLLEVFGQPYMKTAKAKGISSNVRLWKHAFQNAMIPVVTVAGIQIAVIIIGTVTVEIVFAIQGFGRLLVDSILTRNYPVTQVVIVLMAVILVFANLVVDIIYTFIDPRIRYGGEGQ
jgi:peptide/nickel transport system permease protein